MGSEPELPLPTLGPASFRRKVGTAVKRLYGAVRGELQGSGSLHELIVGQVPRNMEFFWILVRGKAARMS